MGALSNISNIASVMLGAALDKISLPREFAWHVLHVSLCFLDIAATPCPRACSIPMQGMGYSQSSHNAPLAGPAASSLRGDHRDCRDGTGGGQQGGPGSTGRAGRAGGRRSEGGSGVGLCEGGLGEVQSTQHVGSSGSHPWVHLGGMTPGVNTPQAGDDHPFSEFYVDGGCDVWVGLGASLDVP